MCSKEGPFMPSNYREMYFHLFRETEKAIRILQEAQAACEELYLAQAPAALTVLPERSPKEGEE